MKTASANSSNDQPIINIIGNGVGSLLTVSEFLLSSEERKQPIRINWIVAPELGDGASPSG